MSEKVSEQKSVEAEFAEVEVSQISPKDRKRYKARLRKRRQRDHEKKGIPSGIEARLKAEWKQNLAAIETDPEKAEALRDRLVDFNFIRSQMSAVIDRIRRGVHAESPGDGRFYDCVAADVQEHVRKYGLQPFLPPCAILLLNSGSTEPIRQRAIDDLMSDPKFFYRLTYGLNIDSLGNLEYEEFFQSFFDWYLKNRDNPTYEFDWEIADQIYSNFVIPEKFLTGILARPWRVWTKLHVRRNGISVETPPASVTSISETNPTGRQ